MYINKNNKKEAVSPVIAVILMVAITVVLAAVLFVMVQQYTQEGESIESPLGASAGAHTTDYWVININAGTATETDLRFQLQSGGAIAGAAYNVDAADVKATSATAPNATVPIVWMDNDANNVVNSGDSIRVYRTDLAAGSYSFLVLKGGSQVLTFTLNKS